MGWLKNLVGFENSFTKNFTSDIFDDPTRLITGIDPLSTKAWNTVLGTDNQPLVNLYGSPEQQYYDQATAEGIDTGAAGQFHGVADAIAGMYGTEGLNGLIGSGASGLGLGSGVSGAAGAASSTGGNMDWIGAGASLLGGLLSSKGSGQSGSSTSTTQQQLDPRIAAMLFGNGTAGNTGLLSQYQQFLNQPQGAGSQMLGQAAQHLLQNAAPSMLQQQFNTANGLANSNIAAPQSQAASTGASISAPGPTVSGTGMGDVLWNKGETFQGARVNAPAQNDIDLTGAYNHFISGGSGSNPMLNNSLQAGIDLSNAGFQKNTNTLTDTLRRQVLPGIRSNAILAGQYGGSRQGIAEGLALSDYTRQLNDANSVLGAQNSANITGQLANSYNQGQDRALAATQGLGAQQYGVASQNAALDQAARSQSSAQLQQANLQNQNTGNQAAQFNAQQVQQANLANQGLLQQNNQFNAGLQQQTGQFNTGLQQQTNLANQQAQIGANSLNSANQVSGLGALGGLLSNLSGYAQNADNAGINRATQVNGLLAPYLSANSSSTNTQPVYSNTGANLLGGAAAGLGLYNQFKGLGGGSSGGSSGSGSSDNFLFNLFGGMNGSM